MERELLAGRPPGVADRPTAPPERAIVVGLRAAVALGFLLAACGDGPEVQKPPLCTPPALEVPWDEDTRSLRLTRSIVVRAAPHEDAHPVGTIAADVRVQWRAAASGPGCDAWIGIEPHGWVCERYLERDDRPPLAPELPKVRGGRVTPNSYASVRRKARLYGSLGDAWRRHGRRVRTSLSVAKRGTRRVRGRRHWRTAGGDLVDAGFLRAHRPSRFSGVSPGTDDIPGLPFGFVRDAAAVTAEHRRTLAALEAGGSAGDGTAAPGAGDVLASVGTDGAWATSVDAAAATRGIAVHDRPGACAPPVTRLRPRAVVPVHEVKDGWARIDGGLWTEAANLRVARAAPRPDDVAPDERWIDVDLDQQVLVAYEGDVPVFATLVSTGRPGADTPEGVFRIWIKFAEKDMRGGRGRSRYLVEAVPWTAFFHGDYGLHTAYWHDDFGEPHSSGCVNLSPRDARALYQWADPWIPHGWSMAYADEARPGTAVRVRNGPLPDPAAFCEERPPPEAVCESTALPPALATAAEPTRASAPGADPAWGLDRD